MKQTASGADLHLHTIYSDGTYTPESLTARAKELALRSIAVTDHDTIDGVAPVREASRACGFEVVAGCEFSVECGDSEIHMLGLFLDPENKNLLEALALYRSLREKRIYTILEKLGKLGITVLPEDVFRFAGKGAPGRLHVAMAMISRHHVRDVTSAFGRYLGNGRPAYERKRRPSPEKTFAIIRAAGGVSVWAHPGLTNRDDLLPELIKVGLQGIEAYSCSHSKTQERHYLKVARDMKLLVSGGSDCHGLNKDKLMMGAVRLADKKVEELRAASGERRK